ncbi:unnamed protein product [Closterium sp. Yama58-4]|nr:unnamed protein product [Closterium sp. Yama58-4]
MLNGRKLYGFSTHRQPWSNEMERVAVLAEKHARGDAARAVRSVRKERVRVERRAAARKAAGEAAVEAATKALQGLVIGGLVGEEGGRERRAVEAGDEQPVVAASDYGADGSAAGKADRAAEEERAAEEKSAAEAATRAMQRPAIRGGVCGATGQVTTTGRGDEGRKEKGPRSFPQTNDENEREGWVRSREGAPAAVLLRPPDPGLPVPPHDQLANPRGGLVFLYPSHARSSDSGSRSGSQSCFHGCYGHCQGTSLCSNRSPALIARYGLLPSVLLSVAPLPSGFSPRLRYKPFLSFLLRSPLATMATEHNPDHVMTEGQIPVGDDTLDELGEEFLEDLADGALPVLNDEVAHSAPASSHPSQSGEPAAKKLCGEGQSSAAGPSGVASASTSAPPSIPRASSSGSSDATAPALGRAIGPSAPRPAPVSRSRPVHPEPEPENAAAGAASGLAPNVRFRNLRRHRTTVGTTLHALTRNTQSLVDVIFPESSAEEVRAAVLTRIASLINGQAFNGVIPSYESATGEALQRPRRTYSRHSFFWLAAQDARIFRSLFPITVRLANNRAMEVKVFSDPNLEFTMARARGDTHMVLRNVPLGYSPERLRSTLLAGVTDAGQPWLSDIRLFHRLKDPYDDSAYSQLLGLPVAAEGDVGFERIPAVLWLPGQEDPVLLNISSHSCSVCSSNHRVNDHACFALTRPARLPNRHAISVSQLQSVNGRLIGQQPAPAAFKKDPGLLLIGVDLDMDVWTCSLCDFTCGLALDSAMYHIASETHRKRLQESAHLPAVKEKYGAWRVSTLLQHQNISAFLQ